MYAIPDRYAKISPVAPLGSSTVPGFVSRFLAAVRNGVEIAQSDIGELSWEHR